MDIQNITDLIIQYKYFIMFLLMFLEWPTVGFISAFLAAKGYLDFGIVYALSIAGDASGDLLRYRIGRFGRNLGIKRNSILQKGITTFQKKRNPISRLLFSWSWRSGDWIFSKMHILEEKPLLKYLERKAKKNFFLSLLIVKITPPLSVPGQFSFGFLKVSFWKFLVQTTFVCFLFESIFLNLWYFSSISTSVFKDKFDTVTTIISTVCIAIIALLIGFFIVRRFRNISKRLK